DICQHNCNNLVVCRNTMCSPRGQCSMRQRNKRTPMRAETLTQNQALAELDELLGAAVVTEGGERERTANGGSRYFAVGQPRALVVANSTDEVSTALAWANRRQIPVSIRGAGTGLAGGAVGYANGLVISLERFNTIREIDPVNRLAVVDAGVITADLD